MTPHRVAAVTLNEMGSLKMNTLVSGLYENRTSMALMSEMSPGARPSGFSSGTAAGKVNLPCSAICFWWYCSDHCFLSCFWRPKKVDGSTFWFLIRNFSISS